MTILEEIRHVQAHAQRLYSEQQIEKALDAMADKINLMLYDRNPLLLCVMNGGIVTTARLMTRLQFPLTIDAINASRYRNTTSGTTIEWKHKPATEIAGRTILIVDDILDEGITMQAIIDYCHKQGAASVYSAVLIDKVIQKTKPAKADFVALQAEDRYLYGYGMDYKGYLRNAPGIFACKE